MTFSWSLTGNAIVQGIAEPAGTHWAAQMHAYGTPIVAGVHAGCGGDRVGEIPIFDLVEQAIQSAGAVTTSIIFASPYDVLDAALEAIDAGIAQLILATRELPPLDMMRLSIRARATDTRLLGPGSAGILIPGKLSWGALDPDCYNPGNIALLGRSQGLLDEVAMELNRAGLGQSLAVELGGGALVGSDVDTWLPLLAADSSTAAIVLVEQHLTGTIAAAAAIPKALRKPLIAYVAGQQIASTAPPQEAATQLISQFVTPTPHTSTAQEKLAAYQAARRTVAQQSTQLAELLHEALK